MIIRSRPAHLAEFYLVVLVKPDLHQIEENHKVPKQKTTMGFGKIIYSKQRVQDTLEGKLGAIRCDSGNVEMQWNNIKECVLDTLSDLVGGVEKTAKSHGSQRKESVKWMKGGNGSISTLKKAGRTTGG